MIQTMKERHEVEAEALLAALSDSQQSRVLQLENNKLRRKMAIVLFRWSPPLTGNSEKA
jgi:hypothetical protein